ncbi:MAG TPA: hypothetical protein VLC92_01535 [Rhodocyclaceae bacterium]|nr:hypothetical protein [Rhodocyclaceae bacterium]
MSKVQKSNKEAKKAPALSLKEKRAAKDAKKDGKTGNTPIQMPSSTR